MSTPNQMLSCELQECFYIDNERLFTSSPEPNSGATVGAMGKEFALAELKAWAVWWFRCAHMHTRQTMYLRSSSVYETARDICCMLAGLRKHIHHERVCRLRSYDR